MSLLVLVLVAAGCVVRAPALSAQHPASPQAESGRLAGAPPSLRAGIVDYKDVPAMRQGNGDNGGGHHHHH